MPPTPPLACTVRACGLLLERQHAAYRCARGHSYDVARRGYVNLLQPHDRRSLSAGDSQGAVAARARLLSAGVGQALLQTLVARAAALTHAEAVVADLGSGSGDVLGRLNAHTGAVGIGIDLSTAAVEHAARRFPSVLWVVANADRRLPLLDASVDLLLSVHGRRNPEEAARVLARDGQMMLAVPAADDLIELRELVQGQAVTRERMDSLVAEHRERFDVVETLETRERHVLDSTAIRDLLRGTYRGERHSARANIETLDRLHVTLASTLVLFRRRR